MLSAAKHLTNDAISIGMPTCQRQTLRSAQGDMVYDVAMGKPACGWLVQGDIFLIFSWIETKP